MKIIEKINFVLNKPRTIILAGEGKEKGVLATFQVLKPHFKIGKDVLVYSEDKKDLENFSFFVKKSSLPILVVTNAGLIPKESILFSGEEEKLSFAREISKVLPSQGYLILNFDDETARAIKKETSANVITFGFSEMADFHVSDINQNGGVNFKINYKGNIVPMWLEGEFSKENIYAAAAAACCGLVLGLNLVEISQSLKS
ncbi:MAG: Mur ligase family protein [Candidatus Pacebacteria bacterium]|nr:Mur ligase family protein [Candidatus Paceibacterota bacterium]